MTVFGDSNEGAKLKCKFGTLASPSGSDKKGVKFADPRSPGSGASRKGARGGSGDRKALADLVISEVDSEESLASEGESVSDHQSRASGSPPRAVRA
jgi:hypothetical protein